MVKTLGACTYQTRNYVFLKFFELQFESRLIPVTKYFIYLMVFQEFVCNLSQVMCYKSNIFFFGGFGNDCLLVGNALVMETAWTSKTLVTSLHVATTQKKGIFFPTAVKTLNPTYQFRARNKLY